MPDFASKASSMFRKCVVYLVLFIVPEQNTNSAPSVWDTQCAEEIWQTTTVLNGELPVETDKCL